MTKGRSIKVILLSLYVIFLSIPIFAAQDYAEALHLTTYYYGAQRCGDEDSWIHDTCHVKDGDGTISDLTGGWHDCGDHVTFGQTAPYAAGALLEGYVNFPSRYPDRYSRANSAPPANGIPDILDEVKVFTDWLIKACNGTRFYYQKGNGDNDHKHMAEPHDYSLSYSVNEGGESDGPRPMSYRTSGGSNVAGDSAAALALMAIAYQPYDSGYATDCFNKAKQYYAIGNNSPGTVGGGSYYGAANWEDDMAWAGAAIYRASVFRGSPENTYRTEAISRADSGNFQQAGYWPLCYDHTEEFANYELYKITSDNKYYTRLADEITYYKNNMASCGYSHVTSWGSLRYAGNMAFAALLFYDISSDASALTFAKANIDFILGDHAAIPGSPGAQAGRSFIIGYTNPDNVGAGSVEHPHHRASFGYTSAEDADGKWPAEDSNPGSIPYKNKLYGALVGGPRSSCSDYNDKIDDYVANEVGVDYNAGINGALGAYVAISNPATPTMTPTFTRTDTPDPSWTLTFTPTNTQTPTDTPIPPPTQKLNLEIKSQGGSDSCSNNTFGFAYRITNWDDASVDASELTIKAFLDTSDSINNNIYNARYYNAGGTDQGVVAVTISETAGEGCSGATKTITFTFASITLDALGGSMIFEGALDRAGYQTPFDNGCDDYTQIRSSWASHVNDSSHTLYQGTDLVCEYTSNTQPDDYTGLHPCTGANGCPGAVTNTQTPIPTNTFTHTYTNTPLPTNTNTHTFTFTNTPSYTFTNTQLPTNTNTPIPTNTYTFTNTNTPLPTNTNTPLPTSTYTFTNTNTPLPTNTFTDTPSNTATDTATNTFTPSDTPTDTPSNTPTDTPSDTPTDTPSNTSTDTPSDTATDTPSNTQTPTFTDTFTNTFTETHTFTDTPTNTNTPTETPTLIPGVDLVLISYNITADIIDSCVITQPPLGTRIMVRNSGTDSSGAFDIDIDGNIINVPSIAAGGSDTVWIAYYNEVNVNIQVDPTNAINESDETNNDYSGVMALPTPIDNCTNTPTQTPTFTHTPSNTPTETFTNTFTETPTNTFTDTYTNTNTPTDTETTIFTPTYTHTFTDTNTPIDTPTNTFTHTPTSTFTHTVTNTPTQTPTPAFVLSITNITPPTVDISNMITDAITITIDATQSIDRVIVTLFDSVTGLPVKSLLDTVVIFGIGTNVIPFNDSTMSDITTGMYYYEVRAYNGVVSSVDASVVFSLINIPTPTTTDTPTNTYTNTPVNTNTSTPVNTNTNTPVNTNTSTPVNTNTNTPVNTNTHTPTNTDTHTPINTNTPTSTNTNTHTSTNTYTFTNTNTPVPISTDTPTATPTQKDGDTLTVTEIMPYPNPYNPTSGNPLKIKVAVSQRNINRLSIRAYTSGYRLIKETVFESTAMLQIINREYIEFNASDLLNLANGTYYYIIIAEKGDEVVRSKIDKLIILK